MIDSEILQHFSGKNVLVTGGTGMIGRQVVANPIPVMPLEKAAKKKAPPATAANVGSIAGLSGFWVCATIRV